MAVLTESFGDRPRRNEPLSAHTTLRLGGPADVWLPVTSLTELIDAVRMARRQDVPVFLLGGGANLLISDAGIRGLVIENRANQVHYPGPHEPDPGGRLVAQSGVGLPNLNRVELLSPDGDRLWKAVGWLEYGYRTSRLKRRKRLPGQDWIVLQAELLLKQEPAAAVEARLNSFNLRRKQSQPPGATIGSMFKNPENDYAGRLIESTGLKGYQVGQARISAIHANFFQNMGGAKSADVMALINTAQAAVEEKFGIVLELEIEVIGESH
jgi:UDP-N-acetylmuramate dehydrogenase